MRKQAQAPQQVQDQQTTQQAQNQPKSFEGGVDMKQAQTQGICFVTFANKVDPVRAKVILNELRKRFPMRTLIFMPRPPKGKKLVYEIDGVTTIVTIPHNTQEQNPTQDPRPTQEGFTLKDLARIKKV
jgi:hypothetical protein